MNVRDRVADKSYKFCLESGVVLRISDVLARPELKLGHLFVRDHDVKEMEKTGGYHRRWRGGEKCEARGRISLLCMTMSCLGQPVCLFYIVYLSLESIELVQEGSRVFIGRGFNKSLS